MQSSDIPPPEEEMAKWEAQFNQMMNAEREDLDFDYGKTMQDAWDDMNDSDYAVEPQIQFDEQGLPILEEYVFGACFPMSTRERALTLLLQRKTTST